VWEVKIYLGRGVYRKIGEGRRKGGNWKAVKKSRPTGVVLLGSYHRSNPGIKGGEAPCKSHQRSGDCLREKGPGKKSGDLLGEQRRGDVIYTDVKKNPNS